MKLKTKLLITFLILILAPIMFTSLAFFGISRYQMNAVKKLYGVENASYWKKKDVEDFQRRAERPYLQKISWNIPDFYREEEDK